MQVGAFAKASSYEHLRARLEHFALPNCRGPQTPHGLKQLLVGPYPSRAAAERLRALLRQPLRKTSFVRHLHGR